MRTNGLKLSKIGINFSSSSFPGLTISLSNSIILFLYFGSQIIVLGISAGNLIYSSTNFFVIFKICGKRNLLYSKLKLFVIVAAISYKVDCNLLSKFLLITSFFPIIPVLPYFSDGKISGAISTCFTKSLIGIFSTLLQSVSTLNFASAMYPPTCGQIISISCLSAKAWA